MRRVTMTTIREKPLHHPLDHIMMAAQSLISRPSETFLSEAERREKFRREQAVKEFYQRNESVYVGEAAFNSAWAKINPWINFQSLMGHLMRNGLVNSASDMEDISSPYLPAAMRHANLKRLLKTNGGNCGHFIFYMSLCDSLESNPLGHGDAVDELKRCAVECNEIPPWLRETGRSLSYPTSSYSSFSSLDTVSEMGPQTMSSVSSLPPSFTPTSTGANQSVPMQQPPATSQSSSSSSESSTQSSTQPVSCDPSRPRGQPTSSASVQPQSSPKMGAAGKSLQNTSGSSGSSQPAAHIHPPYYPKLDSHQMVHPRGKEDTRKLGMSTTISGGAALVQGSGNSSIIRNYGVSSIHAFNNKAAYTSNEPLSYSSENKDPWTIPQPEATRWPTNTYSSDADTERDGFEHPQTAKADSSSARSEQSDKSISIDDIEKLVTQGDIDILSSKYDEEVDLDFPDKTNVNTSSDFMDTLCRFVCAVLNARSSKKIGVFLGGVRALEREKEPYFIEGIMFNDTVINSVEQQYTRRLATVLRSCVDEEEKEVTCEEQDLVRLKFVNVTHSRENRSCKVALVTVVPNVEVCKNHLYLCKFRDSSGRAQAECYKRLEGETVHLRQQKKITALKNSLNNT